MVLQCLTWISNLWDELVGTITIHKEGSVRHLPNDVIADTLRHQASDVILQASLTGSPAPSETMALQCLTWVPNLWDWLVGTIIIHKKGIVSPLPDDVIADILSRLPSACVLKCRRVCRQWLALTSTPHFAEMHLKRATPIIFAQLQVLRNVPSGCLDFFFVDEEAKKNTVVICPRSMHKMQENSLTLIGSCNGLLLFKTFYRTWILFIWNPITQEELTLETPVRVGYCCGIFFHPLTREYRLVYVFWEGSCFQYFICSLGAKVWRKLNTFSFGPRFSVAPAIVNGALHWMVRLRHNYENEIDIPPCANSIMVFNMDTENFHTMPHPGNVCGSRQRHGRVHLLEMEGQLSFYAYYAKFIDVWVLEDYVNCVWVKRYKVNLAWDVKRYPFEIGDCQPNYVYYDIRLLSIQNGELLMDWYFRGLFRYHLPLNTVRKIEMTGTELPRYWYCARFTAYTKSLVSLRDFQ